MINKGLTAPLKLCMTRSLRLPLAPGPDGLPWPEKVHAANAPGYLSLSMRGLGPLAGYRILPGCHASCRRDEDLWSTRGKARGVRTFVWLWKWLWLQVKCRCEIENKGSGGNRFKVSCARHRETCD